MSLEKVSNEVKGVAEVLKPILKFGDAGAATPTKEEVEALEGLLPEGITFETVKSVQGALLNIADGASLALTDAGLPHLKGNKDLDQVSVSLKIGNDEITSTLQRAVQRRNPESGEEFTRHGALSTRYVTGIGAKRGNYKKIQTYAADQASAIFSK